MDEIENSKLEGQEINEAKVLAYEVTKLIHGEEEAIKAQNAAQALLEKGVSSDDMPTTEISNNDILDGINIIDLLVKPNLFLQKEKEDALYNKVVYLLTMKKLMNLILQ